MGEFPVGGERHGYMPGADLQGGNQIKPLANGDAAYPEMLKAIRNARSSVGLSTYHFTNDQVGRQFVVALAEAVRRNVEVRVLVDGYGAFAAGPPVLGLLRRERVTVKLLSPLTAIKGLLRLNNRYHRKLLVIDGRIAYTGGMNLYSGHYRLGLLRDMHFEIRGPLVGEIRRIFAEDWRLASSESLDSYLWGPSLEGAVGTVEGRVIASSPREGRQRIWRIFLAAVTSAQRSVTILTPYFLPDNALLQALILAVHRGVTVHIIVPKDNRPVIHWAMLQLLSTLADAGCHIHFSSAPYDHSKLLLIDELFCVVGSSNWDARSLRFNYELDVECRSRLLAQEIQAEICKREVEAIDLKHGTWPFTFGLRSRVAHLLAFFL